MKRYITLSVLLISLVAVGAYAQAEGDPVKTETKTQEQIKTQTQLQLAEQVRNEEQVQTQTQVQTMDQTRENRDGVEGDKSLDGDPVKTETQTQTQEQIKTQTKLQLAEQVRNEEQVQTQTQVQTMDQTRENRDGMEGDKVLDGECDGDQTRSRELNYGNGDGDNHELGETRRRGDENTGEGGPHGPMDGGSLDGLLKILGPKRAKIFSNANASERRNLKSVVGSF